MPKSASKLSVRVDHGISQPIRAFSLRRARDEDEGCITGVQLGDVGDLVDTGEQPGRRGRPFERICLLHGHPGDSPALGGQGVTGAGMGLFLHEQLLARRLLGLARHDRWCVQGRLSVFPSVLC